MQITTAHPSSSYGIPVILSDSGDVLDSAPGVRLLRSNLGLSTAALAAHCGVSRRTIEGWEQGRAVPCAALNVMQSLLAGNGQASAPTNCSPESARR